MNEEKKFLIKARLDVRVCRSRMEHQVIIMVIFCFLGMFVLGLEATLSLWHIGAVLGACVSAVILLGIRIVELLDAEKLVKRWSEGDK